MQLISISTMYFLMFTLLNMLEEELNLNYTMLQVYVFLSFLPLCIKQHSCDLWNLQTVSWVTDAPCWTCITSLDQLVMDIPTAFLMMKYLSTLIYLIKKQQAKWQVLSATFHSHSRWSLFLTLFARSSQDGGSRNQDGIRHILKQLNHPG